MDGLMIVNILCVVGCLLLVLIMFPIIQISIGAVYLDECPVQAEIPIYLIVLGVIQLVVMFTAGCCHSPGSLRKPKLRWIIWRSIVTMFVFCWFITGNVWIYSVYEPSYNKNTTDVNSYCHKTVYLFSFWTITLIYISLGLFLLAGCLLLSGFFLCLGLKADDADNADNVDNVNNDNDNDSVPATIP